MSTSLLPTALTIECCTVSVRLPGLLFPPLPEEEVSSHAEEELIAPSSLPEEELIAPPLLLPPTE